MRVVGAAVLAVSLLGLLGTSGCGNSNTAVPGTSVAQLPTRTLKGNRTSPGGSAEQEAPPGSSDLLRQIYRQFPRPIARAGAPRSALAIHRGEAACRGKTPAQVKADFYAAAVETGRLQPESPQGRMIARLRQFEARESTDAAFVAGQLAADVYAATIAGPAAESGYEGCVYALARGLEHRLAPR